MAILLAAAVVSGAAAPSAQGIEVSRRAGEYADELRRAAFRLAERATHELLRSRDNTPGDVHDALLAQQIHAGATLLVDMVRGRRPPDEVRAVVLALKDLSDADLAYARTAPLWRPVRDAVADLERELGIAASVVALPPAERPIAGRLTWRGWVDDRVHLVIRGRSVETRTVSGAPKAAGTATFTTPMPDAVVDVAVTTNRGRGTVTVLQQPSRLNDYTAVVEIYDSKGGAEEYRLEVVWR